MYITSVDSPFIQIYAFSVLSNMRTNRIYIYFNNINRFLCLNGKDYHYQNSTFDTSYRYRFLIVEDNERYNTRTAIAFNVLRILMNHLNLM